MLSDDEPLRPGLPFAFFTPDLHFVPQNLLQDNSIRYGEVTKYRFIPHVENLRHELRSAKSSGLATATTWYKALTDKGKDLQADAERFEIWDNQGGRRRVKAQIEDDQSHTVHQHSQHAETASCLPDRPSVAPPPNTYDGAALYPSTLDPSVLPVMSLPDYVSAPGTILPPRPPDVRSDTTSIGSTLSRTARSRPTNNERHQIRTEKKTQIQERCQSLQTPILPDMLERLTAYKTALALAMPLNETAWRQLQPRLQAEAAKLRLEDDARSAIRTAPIPGEFRPPHRSDEYVLAHADTPIKETLCEMAEAYIRQAYSFGSAIIYHTAPQFAADVLLYTREQFLHLQDRIRALRHAGAILQESFFPIEIESLKLEHMRHIFVQTVRPRTEGLRKELFMCNDCPTSVMRYFAFEAVVQHYSTIHTNAFQRGQAQVYWKADWPTHPIFKTRPQRVDTPEPSLTHTPTLSHQPLVEPPQSSFRTAPLTSQHWKTPDTLSLVSNTTDASSVGAGLPNRNLYHVQREALSREVLQAWNLVRQYPDLPVSLQVSVALSVAVSTFNQTHSNSATLQLFKDSLNHTDELVAFCAISRLQCKQCSTKLKKHISPTLLELIDHFQIEHLSLRMNTDKFTWYVDMVELPNAHVIRSLLDNLNLPPLLSDHLVSVHIEAVAHSSSNLPAAYDRGEGRSSRDLSAKVTYIPLSDSEHIPLQDYRSVYISQYEPDIHGDRGIRSRETPVQIADAATWSDPARSRASTVRFASVPKTRDDSTVDDFLSTIESHVDVEMASSPAPNASSTRTSRPISRAGSARDQSRSESGYDPTHSLPFQNDSNPPMPPRTIQSEPRDALIDGFNNRGRPHQTDPAPPLPTSHAQRDYRTGIRSSPRQVIEFDEYGNPVSTDRTTYYHDTQAQYIPYHYQQRQPQLSYHPQYDSDTRFTHRQVRYIRPDTQFSEIQTDEWGRTYIERPAKRQYIELDTSSINPRPEMVYGRPALSARPRGNEATRSSREPG